MHGMSDEVKRTSTIVSICNYREKPLPPHALTIVLTMIV
jgi:hypothetical protein